MKIDAKKLSNFLRKVTINGEIFDCALKFDSNGLSVTVMTADKTGAISGLLSAKNFVGLTPMNASIKDVALFINILKDIPGDVDLSVSSDNQLVVSSTSKDIQLPMPLEEFLVCRLENMPKLAHDGGFSIEATTLMAAKKDAEKLKSKSVNVAVKGGRLHITAGEEGFDKIVNKAQVEYRDVASDFGETFLKVINVLEGSVNIAFDVDYPLLFTQTSEDGSIIRWLVSPAGDKE